MSTQIDAHTGIEGTEPGCPLGAPRAHWGRALRMAFTSSATAVRANSNWSWEGQWEEGHGKAWSLLRPPGAFRKGSREVTWGGGGAVLLGEVPSRRGGRRERQLLLVFLGKGGSEGWGREEQSP